MHPKQNVKQYPDREMNLYHSGEFKLIWLGRWGVECVWDGVRGVGKIAAGLHLERLNTKMKRLNQANTGLGRRRQISRER